MVGEDKLKRGVVFLVTALVVALPLLYWPYMEPLQRLVTLHGAALLRFFGLPATSQGLSIFLPGFELVITRECTAIEALAVFAGVILATPTKWSRKLLVLLLVLGLLHVGNLLRLVVVGWLAYSGVTTLGFAHGVVGYLLSLVGVLVFSYATFRLLPESLESLHNLVDIVLDHIPKRWLS